MAKRWSIRKTAGVVSGGLITLGGGFWRRVGDAANIQFLVDVGKWMGPRMMDILSHWGWVISTPIGLFILFLFLRRKSPEDTQQPSPPATPDAPSPRKGASFVLKRSRLDADHTRTKGGQALDAEDSDIKSTDWEHEE